ncbi:hypothetical protein GIB67_002038 [Kingdonia uniflora]|uniref:Zinc knuckle CX2CX4HX4C domain-containing protein n=1 Tax=Kingdonia uniflora TaxID=39325 RepID=A0A7J7KWC3_9MAGN|nr:hypothetical protein GIB67_002038 [Kingdonia uniflora]
MGDVYNIPKKCWTREGLSQISSLIRKPLYIDKAIERKGRPFARICVEVSVQKELPDHVTIEVDGKYNIIVGVEYNLIPPRCYQYKVFGHLDSTCPYSCKAVEKTGGSDKYKKFKNLKNHNVVKTQETKKVDIARKDGDNTKPIESQNKFN